MEYSRIEQLPLPVSKIALGSWAFGGDVWWGAQNDHDSVEVIDAALTGGVTLIDTAPVYGRGRSETVIGNFLRKRKLREKALLATKLGLTWDGPRIIHDLSEKRMRAELDESRRRLSTDYFDIYQIHWPDPDVPIGKSAALMHEFYQKEIVKAIGVSNYSVSQMEEFLKYAPLHTLQPPYNMFRREIEEEIVPFCARHNIAILGYIPLHSGILTGKFFFDDVPVPDDLCRRRHKDLHMPLFSINKEVLTRLKAMAQNYCVSLTQLVINWTAHQPQITSVLVGARTRAQLQENSRSLGWEISAGDTEQIEQILAERQEKIRSLS